MKTTTIKKRRVLLYGDKLIINNQQVKDCFVWGRLEQYLELEFYKLKSKCVLIEV